MDMTTKTLGDIRSDVRGRLDDPTFDTLKLDEFVQDTLDDIFSRANFSFERTPVVDASSLIPLPQNYYGVLLRGVLSSALEWNDDYDLAAVQESKYERKLARLISSDMNNADESENLGDANDANIIDWFRPTI